jgi:hypothetical protein
MKPPRVKSHGGKFVWKGYRNNVGVVWGWWTFRSKGK